jgi:multiple sugar transport system substrate-binding protein
LNTTWLRKISMLVAIVMLAGLIAACSSGNNESANDTTSENSNSENTSENTSEPTPAPEDYKGDVVVWTWEESNARYDELKKVFPNINVIVVPTAYADMMKKVQTTVASGGDVPDIITFDRTHIPSYIDMGVLENLSQAPYNADKSKFFDYVIPGHVDGDGNLISIPYDISVSGLAYKKALAKEYFGTDDPTELENIFTNWDIFIEKGQEVLEKSGGKVKMLPGLEEVRQFMTGQRSGEFMVGNKLNTDVAKSVLDNIVKLRDSGVVDNIEAWSPTWNASFAQDNHIFAIAPVWAPVYVLQPNDPNGIDRWGLMVPPGGGVIMGGSSFGLLKDGKNKEAAWKVLEYLYMTEEGAEIMKTSDLMYTHAKAAYEDPAFTNWQLPLFGQQDIGSKFFVDISLSVKQPGASIYDQTVISAFLVVLQALNTDKNLDAAGALEKLKEEIKIKDPTIVID